MSLSNLLRTVTLREPVKIGEAADEADIVSLGRRELKTEFPDVRIELAAEGFWYVPLKEIIDIVLKARPVGLSFEGANPRHAHEWKVFRDVKLPEGKVIIPGVLDTTTNFIEHPELVAERIVRYAELVGRENVIAGSDCGFGTSAWGRKVETKIVWAKLQAMVEGARLASQVLW